MNKETLIAAADADAWATKVECVGEYYGKTTYGKLPVQSTQKGFYSHEKLFSEKTVLQLLSEMEKQLRAEAAKSFSEFSPLEQLSEILRGLEIPPTAATLSPGQLYLIAAEVAKQAKAAKSAEPQEQPDAVPLSEWQKLTAEVDALRAENRRLKETRQFIVNQCREAQEIASSEQTENITLRAQLATAREALIHAGKYWAVQSICAEAFKTGYLARPTTAEVDALRAENRRLKAAIGEKT